MFRNELIIKYKVATCHYTVAISCNSILLSIIISDLQFLTSKRAISIRYIDNEYYINERYLWLLAICYTFCSILIRILFHFSLSILSCSITIVQHLRFDYCENFKLA